MTTRFSGRRGGVRWLCLFVALLLEILGQSEASAATLAVVGVNKDKTQFSVGAYYWTLEEDTTYPIAPGGSSTNSMAASFHKSYMPVVASGCVGGAAPQCTENRSFDTVPLDPNNRYFVSVLPLVGGSYTNGGASFKGSDASVSVYVNQLPLPLAQISVFVSEDASPINGFPDPVTEKPLEGFRVFLIDAGGRYGISGGPDAYDAFGNSLGTTYELDAEGYPILDTAVMGDGFVTTDANGMAVLKYLPPGKLSVLVLPPQGQEAMWSQTTTIEGTKVNDAWIKPNEPPYLVEFGPPGPHIFISFANTTLVDPAYFTGGATITGQVVNDHISRPPAVASSPGAAFKHTTPWIGLNDSATQKGIYVKRCNPDGTFSVPNLNPGTYQLVIWDDNLDIIINFSTVIVGASNVALGKIPVMNWFARQEHRVFLDQNENGFPDPGEGGITDQVINHRMRDGTVIQSFTTGVDGRVAFNEIFPFFNWQIAEVDFLRYKATGVTVTVDEGGPINPADPWSFGGQLTPQPQSENAGAPFRTETGPSLLEGFQAFAGQTSVFQWGKKPYGPDENGGITGIVHYAVTRAEDDPTLGAAEPWEPGIPRVQVNLYRDCNADGIIDVPDRAPGSATCLSLGAAGTFTLADVDNPPLGNFPGPEDVDRNNNGVFDFGHALQVTWTDSWDDNIPTGCQGPPFILAGTSTPADCFDGLLNWNQVRPAVFDGGYAFGTATGATPGDPSYLLPGIYIVEAVPPPGYELVKEEDKNIDFGDNYVPQDPPTSLGQLADNGDAPPPIDPFPPLGAPPCVGERHFVQSELSLFPGVPSAFAGQARRLCDRKLVVLQRGANAAANFFLFTRAPVAGHIVGLLTDDITNDPRPGSPNAGEKYSPPSLPISIQDWTGREIARTYSDAWGRYNALVPSTYTANTPLPSGVTPQMLTACLNAPVMPDPANPGQFIPDPWFNKYYGQFCYALQYMPGATTYLDTPVLPTSAFVGPTQFQIDCEPQDATPVVYSVTNGLTRNAGQGPWVSAAGQQLHIFSMGNEQVPNPAYNPTYNSGVPQKITRDHGFGATPGTVTIGGTTASVVSWNNGEIVVSVPGPGEVVVTRSNGNSTVNSVTVSVGGPAPILVGPGQSIQAAIDGANDGNLITVAPGRYAELLIVWKPVRLQGWGAGSTTIDAVIAPFEKVEAWRQNVLGHCRNGDFTLLPGQKPTQPDCASDELLNVVGLGGAGANVLLESPGAIVLGKATGNFVPGNSRIDGLTFVGSVNGGGIIVNGYAHGLEISNNRVSNNMGVVAGGIRVGHTDLIDPADPARYQSAFNDHLNIHHNMITQNGGTARGAGGLMLGTGSDSYQVISNWVCGNITLDEGGGGIGHHGLSKDGLIAYNGVLFNEAWSNQATGRGGGIFIAGLPPLAPQVLTDGAGSVTINSNLILGNATGAGDGAGIAADRVNGLDVVAAPGAQASWYRLDIFNNMIVNNVAGLAGGGIALQDAANARIMHDTVANNDSTATAAAAFAVAGQPSTPQPAGIVSRAHSAALATASGQAFSSPTIVDTILWHNRSFRAVQDPATLAWSLQPAAAPWSYNDLGVLGAAANARLSPTFSILTDRTGYAASNLSGDPRFLQEYFNYGPSGAGFELPGVLDEGGNFLRVVFGPLSLTRWSSNSQATGQPWGNYHIRQAQSPAVGAGQNVNAQSAYLSMDFDRGARPMGGTRPDIGADEVPPQSSATKVLP